MNTQAQLEELLTALATLTEHNTALQQQLAEQSTKTKEELTAHNQQLQQQLAEQVKSNNEQQQQMTNLIAQLTAQLEQYQTKESKIIQHANDSIAKNINKAFDDNEQAYHALINQGFTQHIDQSTAQLLDVTNLINKQLEYVRDDARRTAKEFNSRQSALSSYEQSYSEHSKALEQRVSKTLQNVTKDAQNSLEELGAEFASKMSTKLMAIIAGFGCAILMSFVIISWALIPSKSEIAERQSQFNALEKAQLLDNVRQSKGAYYGRINPKDCYKSNEGIFSSEVTYCKFD